MAQEFSKVLTKSGLYVVKDENATAALERCITVDDEELDATLTVDADTLNGSTKDEILSSAQAELEAVQAIAQEARSEATALTTKTKYYSNRNLLDNAYFAGAEIYAKSGVTYYSGGVAQGVLSADTKVGGLAWATASSIAYYVTVSGVQYAVNVSDCYQKSGTFPINQRGAVCWNTVNTHTIDRFQIYRYVSGAVTLTSDGITIDGNLDYGYIIESARVNDDDVVTISALLSDGTLITATATANNGATYQGTGFNFRFIRYWITGYHLIYFSIVDTSIEIKAVKLELGDQQTLAHQDADGNWVLNEVPDYGEELLKCTAAAARTGEETAGTDLLDALGISGAAKIETGSYTGTGTYGSGNPNTLTFGFEPTFLMVRRDYSTSSLSDLAWLIWWAPMTNARSMRAATLDTIYLTQNGSSFSWYQTNSSGGAYWQLNGSGQTYVYVAIG